MKLPEDCFLSYYILTEAWYADTLFTDEVPTLLVAASAHEGGCAWEFQITEHDLGGQCTKIAMFSDSYDALTQIPEFFQRMATETPGTLKAVREILDSFGAKDTTVRTEPGGVW